MLGTTNRLQKDPPRLRYPAQADLLGLRVEAPIAGLGFEELELFGHGSHLPTGV
jgi:hypothetical protein